MKSKELHVLALNSGSSSLKFGLYRAGRSQTQMLIAGEVESIGSQYGKFEAGDSRNKTFHCEKVAIPTQAE
jgi:acetate kinase